MTPTIEYRMFYFKKIIEDTFYLSLLTWLIYFILELGKEGLISNYFDLNLLLLWTIGFGVAQAGLNIKTDASEEGGEINRN